MSPGNSLKDGAKSESGNGGNAQLPKDSNSRSRTGQSQSPTKRCGKNLQKHLLLSLSRPPEGKAVSHLSDENGIDEGERNRRGRRPISMVDSPDKTRRQFAF